MSAPVAGLLNFLAHWVKVQALDSPFLGMPWKLRASQLMSSLRLPHFGAWLARFRSPVVAALGEQELASVLPREALVDEAQTDMIILLRVLCGFVHCNVRDHHIGCRFERQAGADAMWVPLGPLGQNATLKTLLESYEQCDVFRVFRAFDSHIAACPALPTALLRIHQAHEHTWNALVRAVPDEASFCDRFVAHVAASNDDTDALYTALCTVERAVQQCNLEVAAQPLPADGASFADLLVWLARRYAGVPIAAAVINLETKPRPPRLGENRCWMQVAPRRTEFERLTAQVRSMRQDVYDASLANGADLEGLRADIVADLERRERAFARVAAGEPDENSSIDYEYDDGADVSSMVDPGDALPKEKNGAAAGRKRARPSAASNSDE